MASYFYTMIRNIIFDLGAVVLNIDFQLAAIEFRKLGITNFDKIYSRAIQNNLFSDMEKGIISPSDFRNELRSLSNLPLIDNKIDFAWNSLILDFPPSRLKLIRNIANSYRIFLLSNTNEIHYNFYQADLRNNHNIDGLESIFEKTYFSHKLGMRKPDLDIFKYAINDANILAEETIFIDDSIQNIEAANKLKLNTIFIDTSKASDIADFFYKNGKLISKK